jgi:L-threonylcarbamoyladenylate synthase
VGEEIRSGKVVIFPTDTVFGLGSNPRLRDAVLRCFEIKGRLKEKQLPVLFSEIRFVEEFVEFNDASANLAEKFWPGKLSLVLPVKNIGLPFELIGDSGSLAVRVPNHDCCRKLIASCGGSLIGTSANISGSSPFTDPQDEDLANLAEKADFFVSGECSLEGKSSTVVDMTEPGTFRILREGAIPNDEILNQLEKTRSADFSFRATTS